eukprot:COSAG06_NODE_6999_length_2682_cov_3.754549_1_plen_51_part_10
MRCGAQRQQGLTLWLPTLRPNLLRLQQGAAAVAALHMREVVVAVAVVARWM